MVSWGTPPQAGSRARDGTTKPLWLADRSSSSRRVYKSLHLRYVLTHRRYNLLVEDQEAFQNLQFMLVGHGTTELVVQLGIRQGLGGL